MLRITPYSTFESPPRHVYTPDDIEGLTHGLGASLPWDAAAPPAPGVRPPQPPNNGGS
jgi:hypothetical protein